MKRKILYLLLGAFLLVLAGCTGASEEETEQVLVDLFSGRLAEMKEGERDFEATATISLSKVDGEWKIDEIDDESDVLDCLTGGINSAVTDISDSFNME